jgi:hypothetical protein
MLELAGRLVLAGVLLAGSATKLASPVSSRAALATFGIHRKRAQFALWATLIGVELALAAGILAGLNVASWLAAALMAGFALLMLAAVLSGRNGAPCACFGSRSRVGWPAVGMGDEFGVSGTGEACMEHFGLTARGIADRAREALVLKPIVSHPPLHGPEWT